MTQAPWLTPCHPLAMTQARLHTVDLHQMSPSLDYGLLASSSHQASLTGYCIRPEHLRLCKCTFLLSCREAAKDLWAYRSRSLVHCEKMTDLTTSPRLGMSTFSSDIVSKEAGSSPKPLTWLSLMGLACENGRRSPSSTLSTTVSSVYR